MARVTQPGFRNNTRPRFSFRGTCVCPCNTTSIPFGGWSGGTCCRRKFNPLRSRSTTSGQSRLLSQFPRTTVIRGPTARSSSIMVSVQTSPRCQISSAPRAISFTLSGKRLCVSASTKMRHVASFDRFSSAMLLRFCSYREAEVRRPAFVDETSLERDARLVPQTRDNSRAWPLR